MPETGRARVAILLVLALAGLRPLVGPGPPPRLAVVATADGCALGVDEAAPPCACRDVPGVLRMLHGRPIPLDAPDPAWLTALPGVGPVRARAIVAHAPYDSVDDLLRVPGIGPGILARIAPHVFAGGRDPACDP